MLNELLRNGADTKPAVGQTRRGWLVVPVSVAMHVAAAAAYLIIPLAAEVTLPTPAPPFVIERYKMPVAPPRQPVRVKPVLPGNTTAVPIVAPTGIRPEQPHVTEGPAAPGALDGVPAITTGVGDPLGTAVVGNLVAIPAPPPVAERTPIRVGGAVRAPARIAGAAPVYPQFAVAARIEGTVILDALIDDQGQVDRVRVLKSVPLLDNAAIDAVRTWRYTPSLLNGVPVSVMMTVTVTFTRSQ